MKYIIILIFFTTNSSFSQKNDTTHINLNPITITANIQSTELKQLARNITIISAKQIEESPVKTIDGILQYALNVDVRTRSPFGVQADIGIRGGHFDQTLILVDGIKMNDPQTGHHSLNLPISISEIEKIEVLQGGASRVFGPAAFSGVVNIITKKTKQNSFDFASGLGQHGLKMLNGSLNFINKTISSKITAETIKSDGYAYNTAFQKRSLYSKNSFSFNRNVVSIQSGSMINKFGASNFYHPKFNNQYEEVTSKFLISSLVSDFSNKFQSTANLSLREHTDLYDFNLFRASNPVNVNYHKTNVVDTEWKSRWINQFGKTSFGFEWRSEKVISNRLGDDLVEPIEVKSRFGQFYTKGKTRINKSAFVEHQKQYSKLFITVGSLINLNSQFGTKLYPGIDASFSISEKNTIYGSINKSLRFPTFTEMYLNTSTVKGNPNVKPENAWSYEIGFKSNTQSTFTTLSTFLRDSKSAIDKVSRVNQPTPTIENLINLVVAGVEFSTIHYFDNKVFKSVLLNYSYTKSNKSEVDFQSFYTLNYLKQKLVLSNSINLAKNLNLVANYTFKIREGFYQLDAASPQEPYTPVHLIDTRLYWNNTTTMLYIDINNLMNFRYYEYGFVEQPRRWISIGLNLKFL